MYSEILQLCEMLNQLYKRWSGFWVDVLTSKDHHPEDRYIYNKQQFVFHNIILYNINSIHTIIMTGVPQYVQIGFYGIMLAYRSGII